MCAWLWEEGEARAAKDCFSTSSGDCFRPLDGILDIPSIFVLFGIGIGMSSW